MPQPLSKKERKLYQQLSAMSNQGQGLNPYQQEKLQALDSKRTTGGAKTLLGTGYTGPGTKQKTGGAEPNPNLDADVAKQLNKARPMKRPGSVYNVDVEGEMAESKAQLGFYNPNVSGPLGSTKTTMNEDGTINVEQALSGGQAQILGQGEALTQAGMGQAQNLMNNYGQFQFDSSAAGRDQFEEEVYGRLTKNMERDKQRELDEAKQMLHNQGVPYSEDPNSKYQKMIGGIQERYDDRAESAKGQATMMGGQEMVNAYNIAQGTHQQGISDMGSLSGMGTGLLMPNFEPYKAPNYDVQDPSYYLYKAKELQQAKKGHQLAESTLASQNALAEKQLALQARPPGAAAPEPPPFP